MRRLAAVPDVAFQGFDVWHSVQYLGLVWYLRRCARRAASSTTASSRSATAPTGRGGFHGLAVLLTAAAGMLVLIVHGAFAVDLQKAYYIVILSTLLQHHLLDHLQFTKLGDMLGSGDRLLSGRVAA